MAAKPRIRFFIDECVPDSVGRVFEAEGFGVIFLREVLPQGAPDPIVAATSEKNNAVLVSLDGDFKALAPRITVGRNRFRKLSRVWLRCEEPDAAGRVAAAMSLIISEWRISRKAADKRMIVQIGRSFIRTDR